MKLFLSLVCGILVVLVNAEKVRYDNYRLYKAFADEKDQLDALQLLEKIQTDKTRFWKEALQIGDDCDIMVAPERVNDFENFLEIYKIRHNISIPNIQKLIDIEDRVPKTDTLEWTNYHSLETINKWIFEIIERFPNQVSLFNIGKSYEGRDIFGVKISYKTGNPGIFIEANMHAREWISSATITWMVNELLTSTDSDVRDLAENNDWYVIPVLNPDGFVYSHEKDRMWRKSRQPHTLNCYGADMNRNFDFLWMTAGASQDPCSEIYAGPKPNSEPEIQALIDYFDTIPNKINIYVSMHSYGQLVLSPYGHTNTEFPSNYDDMLKVASGYADAVQQKFGTQYRYGASSVVLYQVSGSSKEWAYGVQNIPITYTIELRDQGRYGFVLPPDQIIPTAQEVLDGYIGLVKAARNLKYL